MSELPSDWAIERALARFPNPCFMDGKPWSILAIRESSFDYARSVRFLAQQIEEHEEPTIDPIRLTVAAPIMLEALETASWLLADISPDGLVKQKVDDAIAKARGEA